MGQFIGPTNTHIVVVHVVVIPLLDPFLGQNEVDDKIDRDPEKVETNWEVEEFTHVKLEVDCKEPSLLLR